ncbi:YhdH/YhfP family quinone oxidoreductase [Enterococcus sp. LJL98]
MSDFIAFEVNQEEHVFSRGLTPKKRIPLQEGHVEVQVDYSDINYKDSLAATKNGGVIRKYPMTPGIDLAGEVVSSKNDSFAVGDKVLVTGYGLGVSHPGGFSQYQQVPVEWLVKIPSRLTTKSAMQYGTAGFTAALAVLALEEKNYEKNQTIYITGASGGVGSITIALLKRLGYENIVAISRKKADWLIDLGATKIIAPAEVIPEKIKPLDRQSVTAVIDTVGGDLLSAILPQLVYNGSAYLCGNAAGIQFDTTVLPFILRGIQVVGIDSVAVDHDTRLAVWDFLAQHQDLLETLKTHEVLMSDLDETIDSLLAGKHEGRTIVKMEV